MSIIDDRYRAFVLWLVLAAIAIAIAFAFSILLTIIVTLFFLAALWIARSLWSVPDVPYTNIRIACITLLTLTGVYYVAPRHIAVFYNSVMVPVIGQLAHVQLTSVDLSAPSYWPLLFIFCGIALVLWSLPDRTIMRPVVPPNASEKDGQFIRDLVSFLELWEHRLGAIDRMTNWSNRDFVPLDAEVEVHSLVKNKRSVGDLLTTLREDKTDQPILILGEPGSGKSVALRRLCRELIKETPKTKRLPLYINLRNWTSTVAWSEENPPTTAELRDYVHAYVHREADDLFADRFLKAHFDEMLQRGIIFFIFDSFDEIPAVMDQPENSWVIGALSDVIGKFLRGAHASRGIVASRYFKRPTDQLEAGAIYRIKPFDDARIWTVLERVGVRTAPQIREVFQKRSDLIAAATNPLIANLLAMFVREHGGEWPSSKLILFNDYILRQLSDPSVVSRMTSSNLTQESCIATTIVVASAMTESDTYGLEIPMDILTRQFPDLPVMGTLHILKFARLGRLNADSVSHFSFAHRRFQEFFVVVGMIQKGTTADKAAIIVDTRYRDIYSLYCEVAEIGAANAVAVHCWGVIKDSRHSPEREVAVIQALRFLTEAFRSRRGFTETFLSDLKEYISRELTAFRLRPLAAKFVSEAIALLDDARAADVFPKALAYKSAWVRETAFRACRHLGTLSEEMKTAATILIRRYRYESALGFSLLRHHRELKFSLSISDGFRSVKRVEAAWVLDVWIVLISMTGLIVLSPIAGIATAIALYFMNWSTTSMNTDEYLKAFRWIFFFISAMIFGALIAYLKALAIAFDAPQLPPEILFAPWAYKLKSLGMTDSGFLLNVYYWSVWLCLSGVFIPVVPFLESKWGARDTIAARVFGALQRLMPGRVQTAEMSVAARPKRQQTANSHLMGRIEVIVAIGKSIQETSWKGWMKILSYLLGIFFIVAICYSVWRLLGLKIIVLIAASVVSVGIVVGTVWIAVQKFRHDRADKKIMDSCKVTSVMQRETIEEILSLLKGRKSRLKFVRTVATNHVAAVGSWSKGGLPFVANDPVSDELARLEERWLRLDA